MRAVIYARYSTDLQREASIKDQVRACRQRIEREGWTLLATYSDAASSGASRLRPGYQKLLEDARAGAFDVVVAEALDRLSRDQEDVAALYKHLSFAGVKLVTLAEGEINELHVGLKGTMNALFLKDLAQKVRRGLEGRVRQGRSGGGICYGYDIAQEHDARGELIHGGRQVNEIQAAIVLRIFTEFANGKSPRRIALDLNREGIAGPQGAGWGASTINGNAARGTGILNNELYIGRLVWNRLQYVKDPRTGKRVSRLNDATKHIVQEVPDLRIIPLDLWQRVKARQATMARNTRPDAAEKRPFWTKQRPRYLISGLARCGGCGGSYVKISQNLFGCAAARNKGTCTNRLNIRIQALEDAVLAGLKTRLMAPDLFKEFCQEYHREVNRLRSEENATLEGQKVELAHIERRTRKLVALITEDDAPVKVLKQELKALEARQAELERALAVATAPAPLIHPNLAEVYRQKVAAMHEALQDLGSRDEAFDVIRSLIDEIRLVPAEGELRIEIKGELAGILDLCNAGANQKPGGLSAAGLAQQIKMVAGVSFFATRRHFPSLPAIVQKRFVAQR
jgi:DNA invertase Pin-like site-specific DNA recombinase